MCALVVAYIRYHSNTAIVLLPDLKGGLLPSVLPKEDKLVVIHIMFQDKYL